MEIRNQFMHNVDANTYGKCFDFLEGKEAYLLNTYPQLNDLNREDRLKNATIQLCYDVKNLTFNLRNKIIEKIRDEVETDYSKKSQKAFGDINKKTLGHMYMEKEYEKRMNQKSKI